MSCQERVGVGGTAWTGSPRVPPLPAPGGSVQTLATGTHFSQHRPGLWTSSLVTPHLEERELLLINLLSPAVTRVAGHTKACTGRFSKSVCASPEWRARAV